MHTAGRNALMHIYNFCAGRFFGRRERAAEYFVGAMESWPQFPPSAIVVFGMGEVSGAGAVALAEYMMENKVSPQTPIYFTGGVRPLEKAERADTMDLIDALRRKGIPPPCSNETEAAYMEHIFRREMARRGVRVQNPIFKLDDPTDTNTQTNVRSALKLGAGRHDDVMLVTLPYHARRAMGTWRRMAGEDAVLQPLLAWLPALGISRDTWRKSAIACYMLLDEAAKYPRYVKRGYFHVVDTLKERARASAIRKRHTPGAAPAPR
jgi:hypothetical protein